MLQLQAGSGCGGGWWWWGKQPVRPEPGRGEGGRSDCRVASRWSLRWGEGETRRLFGASFFKASSGTVRFVTFGEHGPRTGGGGFPGLGHKRARVPSEGFLGSCGGWGGEGKLKKSSQTRVSPAQGRPSCCVWGRLVVGAVWVLPHFVPLDALTGKAEVGWKDTLCQAWCMAVGVHSFL